MVAAWPILTKPLAGLTDLPDRQQLAVVSGNCAFVYFVDEETSDKNDHGALQTLKEAGK